MFPAYGAYPQGRPQMSADCRHHPISEEMPPQMKMESSYSPFVYESWPHQYGYPVPPQCHSCCNHNPYPTYYPYRPPYPHFQSPPSLHPQYYGSYPVYPDPYPFHYASPPHYTMEIPKYEYDKSVPRGLHCCGCYHHKPYMHGDKGVKIEEQESEAENKEGSLVPPDFSNLHQLQRPIVWVPSEYLKNQERPAGTKPHQGSRSASQEPNVVNGWHPFDYESIKKVLEGGDGRRSQDQMNKCRGQHGGRGAVDHQDGTSLMRPQHDSGDVGQEPKIWSGWMPLNVESLKKLLQNENSWKDHDDQPRNQIHQMPFPMIWLPDSNEEKGKTRNEREASSSESSRQQPCKSEQGADHAQKSFAAVAAEGNDEEKLSVEKSYKPLRTIPVKHMDEDTDMKTSNVLKMKSTEDIKKSTEESTKSKPSSPTKASKLPPICLRVDPLPKKKDGQGKSRSPSPPKDKVQKVDSVKPSSSISENKVKGLGNEAEKKSMETPQQKTETNITEVADRTANVGAEETRGGEEVGEKPKSQEAEEKKPEETLKPEKKILSGTEAATVIQSAYRGYEVRKWQPLKKMRQIAHIREVAAVLKRCIESGASSMDLKQKAALGESIMKLLLKLDTIQGLHSSIRDIRKSVAKELVSLQEMLDTIEIKQPDHSPEETSAVGTFIQIPDKSSRSLEISEAEGQAGETILQATDESSPGPGFSKSEDQGSVEMEENNLSDQISSLHELPAEVPSSMPDTIHEQARTVNDPEQDTSESGKKGIAEEARGKLSDSHREQNESEVVEVTAVENLAELPEAHEASTESDECSLVQKAVDISMEESSIKPIDQDSSTVVVSDEGHVDSADQTEMNHDFLGELPMAVMEEDVPETTICFTPDKSQQVNVESELKQTVSEVSETVVSEPEKLQESDEASMGQVSTEQDEASMVSETPNTETEKLQEPNEASKDEVLIEQDAESSIPENFHVPDNEGEVAAGLAEPVKIESPFEVNDQTEEVMENPVEKESIDNACEENDSATEVAGEEKQIEKVDNPEIVHEEEAKPAEEDVKQAISSTENNFREDESGRRIKEENEKMRSLLEKLIASGKEQQEVICSLNEKLKDLEGKLAKQKQKKQKKKGARKMRVLMPHSCRTTSNGFSKEGSMGLAS